LYTISFRIFRAGYFNQLGRSICLVHKAMYKNSAPENNSNILRCSLTRSRIIKDRRKRNQQSMTLKAKIVLSRFAHQQQNLLCKKIHSSCFRSKSKMLTKSSSKWIRRQQKDPYVKMAKEKGSPSRSIFKLEQIDKMVQNALRKKHASAGAQSHKHIFQKGNSVIDLGASIETIKTHYEQENIY